MGYVPPGEQLERYAELLVGYALGSGEGVKPGEVVNVIAHDDAKPLYVELCRAVWRAGGHVIGDYLPSSDGASVERAFFELAGDEQLDFYPTAMRTAQIDVCDHMLYVHSDSDPHALEGIDPARIMRTQRARKEAHDHRMAKEDRGEFSWTIGLYGTEAMAAEAGLSIEEFWEQIVAACFLDDPDPAARWREVNGQIDGFIAGLDALEIDRLHVVGPDCDLRLTLGEQRRWIGGGGKNIPSFEVFTSPDWRGTEGWIRFSEPLYHYGVIVKGVELEFSEGRVTRADAAENGQVIKEMVATDGADRVGEFSLTDARLSRITKFMANTLFDENVGGPFGNTHLALGGSIHLCYAGDPSAMHEEDWERLGFAESVVHTDIVSTADRTVTATLRDGSERVIYDSGQFRLDS